MPTQEHEAAVELFNSTVELEMELRQLLKQKLPYDKEVTAVRLKLRQGYEKIIFLDYEFAQLKDVEQNLWKYVFYRIIEEYRKKIRDTTNANAGQKSSSSRKLVSAFRTFLNEATGFYCLFIQKLAVHFDLEQLEPIVRKHGIKTVTGLSRRSYDENVKRRAVLSCHKSLIFLGDLTRYREMQLERQRKDWNAASEYYVQARQLVPEGGNPHNQLAVIATYDSDEFAAVYYYYRSLAVRNPFLTAKDNIALLFQKARKIAAESPEKQHRSEPSGKLESGSRRRFSHQRPSPAKNNASKQKVAEAVANLLTDFVRLHSLLFLKTDIELIPELKRSVLTQIKEQTLARSLKTDTLLRIMAINMAALFAIRHQMNENSTGNSPKTTMTPAHASKRALVEKYALLLILDTFTTLLEVGNSELESIAIDDIGQSAVQVVPVPAKRVLPSLRISTKWLKASLEYIITMSSTISDDAKVQDERANIESFWDTYAAFLNSLELAFPHDRGVPLDVPLSEDFEMNGFAPLKNELSVDSKFSPRDEEPFEEMDMRIHDLVKDALEIADSETPLHFVGGQFTRDALASKQERQEDDRQEEADMTSTDVSVELRETIVAGSQPLSPENPEYSTADEDENEEVIVFIARNRAAKSTNARTSPTTAEALLNQALNGSPKLVAGGDGKQQSTFWNRFSAPTLFSHTNGRQDESGPVQDSPKQVHASCNDLSSGVRNACDTNEFSQPAISSVPNASEDPLVPNKRQVYAAPAVRPSSMANSTSLFAYQNADPSARQYELFGRTPGMDTKSFALNHFPENLGGSSARSLNPPPGFPYGGAPGQQLSTMQQQKPYDFSASAFGYPSFELFSPSSKQPESDDPLSAIAERVFDRRGSHGFEGAATEVVRPSLSGLDWTNSSGGPSLTPSRWADSTTTGPGAGDARNDQFSNLSNAWARSSIG